MSEVATKIELDELITDPSIGDRLLQLDAFLIQGEQVECPLEHSFTDGQWLRERFVPAGTLFSTYTWKKEHPYFGMLGELLIWDETNGWQHFQCPCYGITKAGTKRVVYAITDVIWTTCHYNPDNITDIDELEEIWLEKYENPYVLLPELKK